MNDIDWSKAPEGATHCDHRYMEFYRPAKNRKGGEFYDLDGGGWMMLCDDFSSLAREPSVIPRLSPTWNGEGLPPAGCKVEYLTYGDHWKVGTYVGQFNGQMVCGCDDSGVVGVVGSGQLRPIRTPEQIAADEREAAVAEMLGLFGGTDSRDTYLMQCLYDAGYRKQAEK